MKLGEIKDQSFFVHDDIVKYKMNIIPNKNESMCSIVTVGNIKNKSLNNIVYNDKICNISNETIVAKWNINDLRLKIYSFNNFVNVLLDSKFNAYDFRNTNMWSSLSFNIHNYSFYEGEVIFDVIDGLISTDSIKLHKSKFNNDKENILDLLYSKFVNNLDREKNIIFNTLFIENKLFNYINSLEEKLDLNKNSLDDSVIFNLRQVLDIIKFCVTKSDFFNALINIRSIRNLIFGYIFENYFLVKYRNIITIDRELSFKQEFINLSEQNKIFNNDLEEDKKNDKYFEETIKQIQKELKKLNSSKKYSIIEIQEELESYHSIPVYFFQHNFASLDIENLKSKKIDAKSIIEWIKLNIFDQDIENILKFEKANILTNNSVHKNHYDKEGFKGWYINENELDILYETLQIYMEILFNTLKLEKEKIWQIKQK